MPLDAGFDPVLRTHLDLRRENGGYTPWCGPAALALATGRSHAEACALLRQVSPAHYPEGTEIVASWWRDLVEALHRTGTACTPQGIPAGTAQGWISLAGFVRRGLEPGWYLLRVTDHFLLLHVRIGGLALVHDNRHTAVPVSPRAFGQRRVTHAVRLHGAPGLPGTGAPHPAQAVAG
jgi:hypothetical protein